jgi:hypothetical protein
MNDDELRALIRQSIARHLAPDGQAPPRLAPPDPRILRDPSHALLPLARGDDACIIEPAVRCTHCGYCLSYGH